MLNIAVFVSGRGSNLKSVYDKVPKNKINVSAVVSDRTDCIALDFARINNIPIFLVSNKKQPDFVDYVFLKEKFIELKIDLILLAGFLKKIPDEFVDYFENKIINIHPALLPSFGGKGMYGINVHREVFNSHVKESGATVHFVDKIYDNGKIIFQKKIDISDTQSPEEIASRLLTIEHEILPFVIEKFADNKIKIENDKVVILD